MSFLEILSALLVTFWAAVALDRRRWWPHDLRLPAEGDLRGGRERAGSPRVTVVIPARNEAAVLGRTLPSLLSQAASFGRLVLLDDRSSDRTGELARELAASSPAAPKVRVLSGEPTPAGWSGKLFALESGILAAGGLEGDSGEAPEWLLLTDADIRHPPRSIDALLARAAEGSYDLVSVMARLRTETFWERLLIPPFVYFFQLIYPFRRVADPRSRVAAAAGGCVLVRETALRGIGGLAAMKGAVIDDVTLASRIKRAGSRCWLGADPGVVSVRAYRGLGEIVDMVARTAFTQLGHRYLAVLGTLLFLGLFFVAPPAAFLGGLAGGSRVAALLGLGAWALESATLLPVVRHHGVAAPFCLTLPVAAALYGYMTALSAWRHLRGHGVRWKGRSVGSSAGSSVARGE